MTNTLFTDYSLGLEELALAFGLINSRGMAQQLLQGAYDNLTASQVDERLTAASHSMLARGLTSLSKNGKAQLDNGLEKALFPLVRFDHLVQLNLVLSEGQATATIHVQKGKTFTAHLVKLGVVHILTHGAIKDLGEYILSVFDKIGVEAKSAAYKQPITLGVLGAALRQAQETKVVSNILVEEGWGEAEAKFLAEDLAIQSLRGTLLRVDGNQSANVEQIKTQSTKNLLALKGKQRSWLFTFSSTQDDQSGTAEMVDRPQFEKAVRSFIV